METNSLMERETNELEVLEFIIAGNHYGINIAKVREILMMPMITPIPNSHPCIEGIFLARDTIITVIHLIKYLGFTEKTNRESNMLMVTNFNNLHIAFEVEKVLGIRRISLKEVEKPDMTMNEPEVGIATGIVKRPDLLLSLLDFEHIVEDICPESGIEMSQIGELGLRTRNSVPIMIVEDSVMLQKLVTDALDAAGYKNLTIYSNGQEAWNKLSEWKQENGGIHNVRCLITDIEMPQMDGHQLIQLMRKDETWKRIPIVVFSSLIDEETRRRGERLGADAHISKPEIGRLVECIDRLMVNII